MRLSAGDKLGPYEVLAPIGAGGMGEVYRARDPRLGRNVAIKVSAERFTERFEREARAVASLNHPNICTLHDVGPNYLVMEEVEGPTLAERITNGAIPLDEVLGLARQIADALDAAHEKGIVHRDLKPSNIKIKSDGAVKVLDFGLAKLGAREEAGRAGGQDLTQSPTLAIDATQAGAILGTAAYMAPEQARGKPVDKRADIWAFGTVLYEMLTARKAFDGGCADGPGGGDQGRASVGRHSVERAAASRELPGERAKETVARHWRCVEVARRSARARFREAAVRKRRVDCSGIAGDGHGDSLVGAMARCALHRSTADPAGCGSRIGDFTPCSR
jgi:serine/threonine protein kinase